jgi:hypothetical protein
MKASEEQVGGTHYKSMAIQPSAFIRANGIGWYEGNIIKYVCRYRQKGETEDIKKVIHYAQLILEEYENDKGSVFGPIGSGSSGTGTEESGV